MLNSDRTRNVTQRRLAIYQPGGRSGVGTNVFGMEVANFDLFRAMALDAALDRIDVLTARPTTADAIRRDLIGDASCATQIETGSILDTALATACGAVLRGGPRLDELAWHRRRNVGDEAYSLIGLIHTIAPPAMRQDIAMAAVGPVQPWDALVCTSPSIKSAMETMFDEWADYLGERFGGKRRIRPQLPLLPLGVNGDVFAWAADRPEIRASARNAMGIGDDDVLILWVGRLSFFEKAFPQPMFRAVAEAAAEAGVRVHFAMVGWFPGGADDERKYRQAASAYAPDVGLHLIDGNDADRKAEMWAASDVFLSLVDNIQETFGITPLEAMAAGLPVVVSDWDGYRYTVEHGEQGFLVPTLGGGAYGLLDRLGDGHALGLVSYQQYVGAIAQHTAVNVGKAARDLARLIGSAELRARMGAAGRERVRRRFDWKVVALQYAALAEDLAGLRPAAGTTRGLRHPLKGDPFRDFAGFATSTVTPDTVLALRPGAGAADLARAAQVELDAYGAGWRGRADEAAQVVDRLADGQARSVRDILLTFPFDRRRVVMLTLQWLAKIGVLDWLAPDADDRQGVS